MFCPVCVFFWRTTALRILPATSHSGTLFLACGYKLFYWRHEKGGAGATRVFTWIYLKPTGAPHARGGGDASVLIELYHHLVLGADLQALTSTTYEGSLCWLWWYRAALYGDGTFCWLWW